MTNTCSRCGYVGNEFPPSYLRRQGKFALCRACLRVETNKWRTKRRAEDPEGYRRMMRNGNLKASYGINVDEFDAMLEAQGGVCAICRLPPQGKRRMSVDHCHTTGAVRKLLCTPCNTAIGLLREDTERFERAVEYIREHQAIGD